MWSDLWLDQPDAHEAINKRLAEGEITEEEAKNLRHFVDEGYLIISMRDMDQIAHSLEEDIHRFNGAPPEDLLTVPKGDVDRIPYNQLGKALGENDFRIVDPHSHSEAAKELYHSPEIFRYIDLIHGQKSIAFQSLYFPEGSEQALHRDPMFVVTNPASHLIACWIALEDIPADCGPLAFVPRSHRLPYFEFGDDRITSSKQKEDMEKRPLQQAFMKELFKTHDLKVKHFVCKKGDVLIWHGNLVHGGSKITRPGSTRKSFVVHYSTFDNYKSRRVTYKSKITSGEKVEYVGLSGSTSEVYEKYGNAGLQNPICKPKDDEAVGGQAIVAAA